MKDWQEDYGSHSYRPNNRGTKMQSRALEPPFVSSKPSLMSMHSVEESTKFENIGKKRVISLKGEDLDDNPYAEINIEEHWGALDKVEDIKKNKSAVRTLRNRQLKIMSQTAMDLIEQEAGFHRMIGRLSDIVMMDDPFCQTLDLSTGIPEDEMKEFREVVMETVCGSSEFLRQMSNARSKMVMAYQKKKALAKKLVPFESENVAPASKKRKL